MMQPLIRRQYVQARARDSTRSLPQGRDASSMSLSSEKHPLCDAHDSLVGCRVSLASSLLARVLSCSLATIMGKITRISPTFTLRSLVIVNTKTSFSPKSGTVQKSDSLPGPVLNQPKTSQSWCPAIMQTQGYHFHVTRKTEWLVGNACVRVFHVFI